MARCHRKFGRGGGVVPTLNAFDNNSESRATVIIFEATRVDDVRIYENYSPTVATYWGTGGARVPYVFPIQGSQVGRAEKNGPQGSGFGDEGGPMFTVNTTDRHAFAGDTTVRRLTPTECERLQGFPDDHTKYRIDEKKGLVEQGDSARYKQMGNAVCVNVVEWIFNRLVEQEKNEL